MFPNIQLFKPLPKPSYSVYILPSTYITVPIIPTLAMALTEMIQIPLTVVQPTTLLSSLSLPLSKYIATLATTKQTINIVKAVLAI